MLIVVAVTIILTTAAAAVGALSNCVVYVDQSIGSVAKKQGDVHIDCGVAGIVDGVVE